MKFQRKLGVALIIALLICGGVGLSYYTLKEMNHHTSATHEKVSFTVTGQNDASLFGHSTKHNHFLQGVALMGGKHVTGEFKVDTNESPKYRSPVGRDFSVWASCSTAKCTFDTVEPSAARATREHLMGLGAAWLIIGLISYRVVVEAKRSERRAVVRAAKTAAETA